jgi:hypothetical protein
MTTRPTAPPPAPPIPKANKSPAATIHTAIGLNPLSGPMQEGDRILLYGTGGIGKSTLAAYLPAPYFFDLDRETKKLNVSRDIVATWTELRGKLAEFERNPPAGVQSVVIDNGSKAEEMGKETVIETRKTEKGKSVDSIEGFGWGKGWQFVYDEFNGLLADLDRINAKGFIVCIIAHSVPSVVPNPSGEDFLRYEPLFYGGDKKGRGSIRDRLKNWADHVLYLAYDVHVEEGKGMGSGTRTIFTYELPTHIAKSRTKALMCNYDINDPGAVWRELGIVQDPT